jgi:hypothetical protein
MTQITIFKNIRDTSTPFFRPVDEILDRIKTGKSKDIVKAIREEKDKDIKNKLKMQLPAICFSGMFNKRSDASLVEYSGIMCLDFDGYEKKKDLLEAKEAMSQDRYVYSVFISPSGDGLKVLVRVPVEPENHKYYFLALQDRFASPYFDKTSKNISRVCYESYDPLIYINENSDIFSQTNHSTKEHNIATNIPPKLKLNDTNEIIRRLKVWWDKNYGMVVGERNNNLFILAGRFNKFGIPKDLASYALLEYSHEGFDSGEIRSIIESAYRNKDEFNTRFFEDVEKFDEVRGKLKAGVSKREIIGDLRDSGIDDDTIDSVIKSIDEDSMVKEFWSINQKGAISLMHHAFKEFLEENGYYKYSPEGSKNYVFVKVTNNLIDNTSEEEIKDFVLNYVMKNAGYNVYNFFADKTRFFKEDFLTMLSPVDVYFISDTKNSAYLYFKNCAVRVSDNSVETIDYIDLGGYVWKNQVIDREFSPIKVGSCDFKSFIINIAGKDSSKIRSIESTIGYLLHGFKNLGYCPAVIINDEVITENPEGGTGKGIFVSAISKMKSMVMLDGKAFSFEKSFAYQLVSADTQLITFDDVRKHFDFERLFSIVTEGITLEKKNKDAIKIPFNKSPKIIITTNYAIKGKGNSFERRKWEIEFKKYYSKDYTPEDEFGRLLFSDWDENEWLLFDNYMISNLQIYLKDGLVKTEFGNIKTRKFIAETDHSFYEWAIDNVDYLLKPNTRIYKQDLYNSFVADNPDFGPRTKMSITMQRFYKWLNAFCLYQYGEEAHEGRDSRGKWIQFLTI